MRLKYDFHLFIIFFRNFKLMSNYILYDISGYEIDLYPGYCLFAGEKEAATRSPRRCTRPQCSGPPPAALVKMATYPQP